ncbi:MAG: hypothetical protein E6J41_26485 [Chloroflexi bacterium]|nr:MAG: hypothetical protein E6J41_26485 [Chloroflexota bacterium]
MNQEVCRPFDVVIVSVGQRDVRTLPSTAVRGTPPKLEHYRCPHPILGDGGGLDLRSYAARALSWFQREDDRAGVAARVELPLLDKVLKHVAERQPGHPPALVLVTSDQPDAQFRPGDTVVLGELIKQVLEARPEQAVRKVVLFPVKANPILIMDVCEALRPLVGLVGGATDRSVPYVAIAGQGGTPALSTAVAFLFAAVARGRVESDRARWEVGELVLVGGPADWQIKNLGRTALFEELGW